VVIELPFDERFSGPPGQSRVDGRHRWRCGGGVVLPVAAAAGWALATLDFTIKMTASPRARTAGERARAAGRRTNSVGAADVYIVSAIRRFCAARCWHHPQFPDQVTKLTPEFVSMRSRPRSCAVRGPGIMRHNARSGSERLGVGLSELGAANTAEQMDVAIGIASIAQPLLRPVAMP